jgi:hypothetical protein
MRRHLRNALLLTLIVAATVVVRADGLFDIRTVLAATPGIPALLHPEGIAVHRGRTYVADTGRHVIRRVIPGYSTIVFAGQLDTPGFADGPLASARFNSPTIIIRVLDFAAPRQPVTFYVADSGNHVIRKIKDGVVTTVGGTPEQPGTADGPPGVGRLHSPHGMRWEFESSSLIVADTGNHAIRRISSDGTITTVAGAPGVPGAVNGPASSARFNQPWGLMRWDRESYLVSDSANHAVRRLDDFGNVSTFAGVPGVSGLAAGRGSQARFNRPTGFGCCAEADSFLADTGNNTIRLVHDMRTVASTTGQAGYVDASDDTVRFNGPTALAMDESWGLVIADTQNSAIRDGVFGAFNRHAPSIFDNRLPASVTAPPGQSVDFHCSMAGAPTPAIYWEVSADGGRTWTMLEDSARYAQTASSLLTVNSVGYDLHRSQYRCSGASTSGRATPPPATLSVSGYPASSVSLFFKGTRVGALGPLAGVTPAQTIALRWGGSRPRWSATPGQSWAKITGGSGDGDGTFTVEIDGNAVASLAGTSFSTTIPVTNTAGQPFAIAVTLDLQSPTSTAAPFGVFETPAAGASGLQGALPITGWALDDVGVDRVEIWRDRAAGETTPVFTGGGPGSGKIFVATATFVAGARPDVENAFPAAPFASRAGWGYMLLTQGLWNQGNGPVTLHAFAFDVEGKSTTIGTKTIAVDNVNATRPFGTIDTPAYGGTVAGTIHNFGWALTPGSSCSIVSVQVSIDSGPLMPVVYGDARPDIAAAFPGRPNSAAAGGHFTLDTTTLSNGMHTIGWLVTDSCGRSEGVGSRFFFVSNGT